LLNWVECHTTCRPGYCQVKCKVPGQDERQTICCFDFPMLLSSDAKISFDSKNRVRFEPKQNDPLLNCFNILMILGWRANIDVKPVLSKDATIKSVHCILSTALNKFAHRFLFLVTLPNTHQKLSLKRLNSRTCYAPSRITSTLTHLPNLHAENC
jgi:hypothetical protein